MDVARLPIIHVLMPGQVNRMYQGESGREGFLGVSGECALVIGGEERLLKAWDFVHCPPWTQHVFIGAGDGPCMIVITAAARAASRWSIQSTR